MHRTQSPDNSDSSIEQLIVARGADRAPRVLPEDVAANIQHEVYFTAAQGLNGAVRRAGQSDEFAALVDVLGLLTICVLVLRNGFTVVGTSACASPENFDAEVGKRDNAVREIWPLMGYALKQRLQAD